MLLELGFKSPQIEAVVLAVSELATNLVRYGQNGEILLSEIRESARRGIQIEVIDKGPGIADLVDAMRDGLSTGGGMGSGLPAARRLMDEFEISSSPSGTRVVTRKWLSQT